MTVSSEQSRVQYATDGVATSFPVPFRFLQNRDLRATLVDSEGNEQELSLGTDYSVTGAGQQSGGTLTTTAAYPAGQTLLIDRIISITQETAYQRNDPFPERAHERALDKLTMICQQLASIFGMTSLGGRRVLMVRDSDGGIGFLPLRRHRANHALGFDANGDPVAIPSDLPQLVDALERAESAAAAAKTSEILAASSADEAQEDAEIAKDAAQAAEAAAELALQGTNVIYRKRRADLPTLTPENKDTPAVVWGDPNPALDGYYVWDGAEWQWSGVQPGMQNDIEFLLDFRTGEKDEQTYVIVDSEFNILALSDPSGIEIWIDFFSSDEDTPTYIAVDVDFNILTPLGISDFEHLYDFFSTDDSSQSYFVVDIEFNILALSDSIGIELLTDFFSSVDDSSYVVVDFEFNLLSPLDALDFEFLYDFFLTDEGEEGYVVVDAEFNIINSKSSSDVDFSKIADSPIDPQPLKTKSNVYFDFNVLTRQNDLRAAIYNASAHTLSSSHAAVYAFYDALVSAYPDRFVMEVLGADALGNEIRQYSYTPQLLNSGTSSNTQWPVSARRPAKMVITTGVHGDEREAIVDVMAVMREVLEEPYFNEQIMLLSQARIVIVPCINPSGIDARNRYNHNDVDINRNAPSGWSSTATKPGNAPLDQLETQIACSLPSLHPDADIFIDRHNYALTLNRSAWFAVIDETLFPSVKRLALHMQAFLPRDYAWLQGHPVRIGKNDGGTTARDWYEASGKPAVLIETVRETPGVDIFVSRQYSLYVTRKSLFDLLSLYI